MNILTEIVTELEEKGAHNGDKNNDNNHLYPVSFFFFIVKLFN